MTNYNGGELGDFVNAIREASVSITSKNPSFYIISLNGGLPLFDILSIVDRNVDVNRAVYFPGSSKINNSREVLTRCFENFFLEKKDESNEVRPLVSLDEVVAGRSVERLINAYNSASRRIARNYLGGSQKQASLVEKESAILRDRFPLHIFGIREARPGKYNLDGHYKQLVMGGKVNEFQTKKIITMDNLDYQTVKFAHPLTKGFTGQAYQPRVEEVILTRKYIDLLHDIARLVGVDPESVNPIRARVALNCEKYSKKPEYH